MVYQLKRHLLNLAATNPLAPFLQKAIAKFYVNERLPKSQAQWLLTRISTEGYGGYPQLTFPATINGRKMNISGNLKFASFAGLWFNAPYCGENPFTVALFARLARESECIFDVGANVGLFTFIAAAATDTARIHAFEPHSELADLLRNNIAANDWSNRITVWPVAIADGFGTGVFYVTESDSEGTLVAHRPEAQGNVLLDTVEVETVRLDDMQAAINPNLSTSLFKIDVEGAESLVLAGSSNVLRSGGPRDLIIELLRDALEDHQLDPLLNAGMQCFKIQGRRLTPVMSSDEALALYVPGHYNFYCTRRSPSEVEHLVRTVVAALG